MIKIIHGDFFKIFQEHIKPKSVDLFLGDPPYGLFKDDKQLNISKNDPIIDLQKLEKTLDIIMAKNSTVLLFCNMDLLLKLKQSVKIFEYRFCHILIKSAAMPNSLTRPINNCEYMAVFKRRNSKANDIIFNPRESGIVKEPYTKKNYDPKISIRKKMKPEYDQNNNGKRWIRTAIPMTSKCNLPKVERTSHPFQKSEELLKGLIRVYSTPESLVIDGFAGSGSTLTSAYQENRWAIGFEIDSQYYLEAKKRIEILIKQRSLL